MVTVETARAGVWFLAILGASLTVFSLWLAYSVLRAAVIVKSDGVMVRNYLRTRRLALADISRAMLGGDKYVYIVLTDGTSVRSSALSPTAFGGTKTLDRIVQELQRAIDECRAK